MSIEWSNFKARIKRCGEAVKILTVVAAIAYSAATPPPAQAQGISNILNQGMSILNGTPTASTTGLPPTNLDSFVAQSGYSQMIYGDESTSLPPLFGFTQASRINTGIVGVDAAGLTTGHGSYMPCAWGADEFLAPPGEWCTSGAGGGNYNGAAAALDAADVAQAALAASQAAANAASTLTNISTQATAAVNGAVNGALSGSGVSVNVSAPSLPGF